MSAQHCPSCNTPPPPGALYCPTCGLSLKGTLYGAVANSSPASSHVLGNHTAPAPIGSLLNGRYQVQQIIGVGSFGRVYLASDTQDASRRSVAIKELLDGHFTTLQDKQEAIAWFKREVSTLLTLEHPAIPAVHGFWTAHPASGPFYLAMDYVPGKTLAEIMQEVGGHVNWRVAVVWGIALCDVLAYLHARTPPIVFRDMKLQNVMIDSRTTRPVLIDFGITRQLAPTGGTAIGTWGYVPYEQITGRAEPRSDIYSLGATLHALVTGRYPDMEYARLLRSGLSVDKAMRLLFPSADTLLADVPLALAQVLTCATSFDATSRYGDASSLATALKQAHHHPSQPLNTQHQVPTTPSSSPSSSQGKSAAGSSGPIPTQSPTPMTTAHEAEHGHMRVQVKRFDVNLKAKPYEPQHGVTYFVLRLLITNEGTTNARYDARAFELQGADSVKYSSMAGFFSHSELAAGILAPGKSVAGDILYTAPTNQQYELLWTVEYPLAPITITLP